MYPKVYIPKYQPRGFGSSIEDAKEPELAEAVLPKQQLQKQLSFVDALNSMTEISLAEDDASTILQDISGIIGSLLAVDQCLIYKIDFEQHQAIELCEWRNPQYPDLNPTKTICDLDLFIDGCRYLQASQGWLESHIDRVNPCLQEDGSAVLLHEENHIQSLLWYSFDFRRESYYLLVFNQISSRREWQQEEISFINATTKQVSIALQKIQLLTERQKAEEALRNVKNELESRVEKRIVELRNAVECLQREIASSQNERKQAHQALEESEARFRKQAQQLQQTLQALQQTQSQLIQTEKMSSLGQLVAGVAHEINNPVTFIYGNLTPASQYIEDLLNLLALYQQHYPRPVLEIQSKIEEIDVDFLVEDLPKILCSMKMGANRIREIVLSLRNFSRLDEAEIKPVDIHEGLNNTLLILQSRLKAKSGQPEIQAIKEYGSLPKVECYAGQINQVFMNILSNALDALEEYNSQRSREEIQQNPSTIRICTEVGNSIASGLPQVNQDWVRIRIADNGRGMTRIVQERLFDPFFTTKPVGQGTGLGLSISYQIVVEKHGGRLWCNSRPGQGTEFFIEIPIFCKQKSDIVTDA